MRVRLLENGPTQTAALEVKCELIYYQAQASAKGERAAGVHMLSCGFFSIFSQVFELIRFAMVEKSSEGVAEGQVC